MILDKKELSTGFNLLVFVAALGYFVDVYDIVLFMMVKKQSLMDIGITAKTDLFDTGIFLHNWQMIGMLVGGIFWGILGDKKGRLKVLFGSIIMYSLANVLNGFVQDVNTYAVLRFFAGVGLAGELGAGITLVAETMTKESRGKGTAMVAAIGVSGAVVAFLVVKLFDWRTSYFVGGGMGFILLALRFGVYESAMYENTSHQNIKKGNFLKLFSNFQESKKYISLILVAVPVWYIVGVIMNQSSQIYEELHASFVPEDGKAVMYCYIGLALGDLCSGILSQVLKSRKKAMFIFIVFSVLTWISFFTIAVQSETLFYICAVASGFAVGYWAVFITTSAESYGTNLRSTASTTAPNFVRGALTLLLLAFQGLSVSMGKPNAAMIVGVVTYVLAFLALYNLKETFGKDLSYNEE
jgi:putative MFS transporter